MSSLTHDSEGALSYGCRVRDVGKVQGVSFGTWIRSARLAKGWTQEQFMAEADLSKSTVNRWENNKGIGSVDTLRRGVLALGLDPREASVRIGLVAPDEWDRPAKGPAMPEPIENVVGLLADERVPPGDRKELVGLVDEAYHYWLRRRVPPAPTEPAASQRARGKRTTKR